METKGSWVGWIVAPRGVILLGGVKRHESSRFESRKQAQAWVQTVLEINCSAHRPAAAWGYTWVPQPAEITLVEAPA